MGNRKGNEICIMTQRCGYARINAALCFRVTKIEVREGLQVSRHFTWPHPKNEHIFLKHVLKYKPQEKCSLR
jgi:hypothetical protein